jgi:hypothetical protein
MKSASSFLKTPPQTVPKIEKFPAPVGTYNMRYKAVCELMANAARESWDPDSRGPAKDFGHLLLSIFIRSGVTYAGYTAAFGAAPPRRFWEHARMLAEKEIWSAPESESPERRGRPSMREEVSSLWSRSSYSSYDGRLYTRGAKRDLVPAIASASGASASTVYKYGESLREPARYTDLCDTCEARRGLMDEILQQSGAPADVFCSNKDIEAALLDHKHQLTAEQKRRMRVYDTHLQLAKRQQDEFDSAWQSADLPRPGKAAPAAAVVIVDWSTIALAPFRGTGSSFHAPACVPCFGIYAKYAGAAEVHYALAPGGDTSGAGTLAALKHSLGKVGHVVGPSNSLSIWADGSRRNFCNQYFIGGLTDLVVDYGAVSLNFFAPGHGKTALDQRFGCMKSKLNCSYATLAELRRELPKLLESEGTSASWLADEGTTRTTFPAQEITSSLCFCVNSAGVKDYGLTHRVGTASPIRCYDIAQFEEEAYTKKKRRVEQDVAEDKDSQPQLEKRMEKMKKLL